MVKQKSNDPAVRWRTLMALLLVLGLLPHESASANTLAPHALQNGRQFRKRNARGPSGRVTMTPGWSAIRKLPGNGYGKISSPSVFMTLLRGWRTMRVGVEFHAMSFKLGRRSPARSRIREKLQCYPTRIQRIELTYIDGS